MPARIPPVKLERSRCFWNGPEKCLWKATPWPEQVNLTQHSAPAGRKELSRSLAGGERSAPPDRIGITIRTSRAPAGARWSRRYGFQGFAESAHPWLSSSRSGAVGTTEVAG